VALDFLLQESPLIHDVFSIGDQSIVKFTCDGKHKTIKAPLSGAFNLSVQSHWTGLFDGSGGGSAILGYIDSLTQAFLNKTITQPWFGRKAWTGTTPFKFSVPIRFVSRFNAYKEVYLPVTGLLSFLYPRIDSADAETGGADVLAAYLVPGPSVFYAEEEGGKELDGGLFGLGGSGGDRVEISVGSFIQFSGCYLTSIDLTVENSFNVDGYPHSVGGTVNFEAMDVSFVHFDGSFMQNKLGNQAFKVDEVLNGALKNGEEGVKGGNRSAQEMLDTLIKKVKV
jgi:hypothetical protein